MGGIERRTDGERQKRRERTGGRVGSFRETGGGVGGGGGGGMGGGGGVKNTERESKSECVDLCARGRRVEREMERDRKTWGEEVSGLGDRSGRVWAGNTHASRPSG